MTCRCMRHHVIPGCTRHSLFGSSAQEIGTLPLFVSYSTTADLSRVNAGASLVLSTGVLVGTN